MNKRTVFLIFGTALLLIGIFMPRDWYDTLPRSEADLPWVWHDASTDSTRNLPLPPIKGVTLLQISFIIEGLVLIWLALKRFTFKRLRVEERLPATTTTENSKTDYSYNSLWLLAAITVLGLGLRLIRLDADLWLDEIVSVLLYSQMPVWQVVTTYVNSNNHLLNTLLMKLAITFFGEKEWAVRLPAVIFGTAMIPALYWVSRLVFSKRASLYTALLLAVSYHHIFFSQNARGYTAYLFFSIVSSGLLVKGLQEDKARIWIFYVLAMLLNFASLLNSGFVLAAHILVGAVALLVVMRRGISPIPLLRRLVAVFGVTTFLVFQLYATIIPQVYVYAQATYTDPTTGFSPFSSEFWRELIRGTSAGFGTGVILGLLPFAAIAGVGFVILLKRQWTLVAALTLPIGLTATFLLLQGLSFSPRFFLLGLPLAILVAVQGIENIAEFAAKFVSGNAPALSSRLATAIVIVGCVGSLVSLRNYYSIPKQNYLASLQFIESERKPDEKIIAVHLTETGYRFYANHFGLKEGVDFFSVRSIEAFDEILMSHGERVTFLVTTFPRALRLSYPELDARISREWTQVHTFPGTIGDGEVSVWKRRSE